MILLLLQWVKIMESFVQFYEVKNKTLFLNNGFSSVWNLLKDRGEIIWIDSNIDDFPDVFGTVYISCFYERDFSYIEEWVKNSPHIKFIVGGPAVSYMDFKVEAPNFYADKRNMFELLSVQPTSDMWNLELPKIESDNVYYNYSLSFGNKCYWGKCNFCNRKSELEIDLIVKNIPILKPNHNIIWLNKLSITPKDISNIFPILKSQSYYSFFTRGDFGVLDSLKQITITKKFRPIIGVEFPSNRMLSLMNKGITTESLFGVMELFLKNMCKVNITLIHGWPNLIEDDVIKVENFLSSLKPYKKQIDCSNHWLFCHNKENNTIPYTTKYGKTYYLYKQNKKQKELNNKVLGLYKSFGFSSYTNAGIFKKFFEDSGELDE